MEYQYGQNNENNGYPGNNYTYFHQEPYGNGPIPGEPKKKEKKSGRGLIPICLVLSLVMGTAGGALGSGIVMQYNNKNAEKVQEQQVSEETLPETTESAPVTPAAATAVSGLTVGQISKMCMPSVVAITNKGEVEIRSLWGTFTQESEGSGSGVIIGRTDQELLIVTNYHVVSGNKELSVLFSYQEEDRDISEAQIAKAQIKDYSSSKDLAVISVDIASLSQETLDNIKVATLGDSNDMELGEQVVAIGNALGYGQSVTTGIVSALGRSVSTQGADGQTEGLGSENRYIQTDAAINPGNSGGAMFNMKGELVGINSAKSAGEYVEGMGYAIPISDIKEDMERMMQQETRPLLAENERGYLGISVSNVTSEINEAYDIPLGAHISSVTEGSPAERAGLQRGMVVTAINGKSVRTREELIEYFSYYKAGETVSFTVKVRTDAGYEDRNFDVTLYSAEEAGITTQENQVPGTDSNSGTEYVLPDGQNPFGGFFPFFND